MFPSMAVDESIPTTCCWRFAATYQADHHHDGEKRDCVLQPVEEIGKVAAEADVYFHTDAVQAAGKVLIDVNRLGCDLLSISCYKMDAPQG